MSIINNNYSVRKIKAIINLNTCHTSESSVKFSASITDEMSTQTEADEVHACVGLTGDSVQESKELSQTTTDCGHSSCCCSVVGQGEPSPVQDNDVNVRFSKISCKITRCIEIQ